MVHQQKLPSRHFGNVQETAAVRFLQARGLTLLRRNYQCKLGEIDLIMRDGKQLVFTEVRYRRNCRYGSPLETVNPAKQRKLILCARHYLQRHPLPADGQCRFDVLGITAARDGQPADYQWVKNAFGC